MTPLASTVRRLGAHSLRVVALSVVAAGAARAQLPATPRALGMAGAYVATARGYESLSANPANLALPGAPRWSIALGQVAASGSLLGARFEEIPTLVDDAADEARQDEILAAIPASGAQMRYDLRVPVGALQIGRVGLGVSYASHGQHSLSRDLVELVAKGYEEGRTDYSVGNTTGSRATYYDVALAYGHRAGPLSLGVTGHYVHGGTLVRAQMFEPQIDVEARDVSVNYLSVLSRGGSGYAVDLGAALQASPRFTLSAALANAVSRMTWSEELRYRDFRVSRSDINDLDFVSLRARYEGSEQPLDPSAVPVRAFEAAQGLYDGAVFPAVARVGADWRPLGGTNLGAVYQRNLSDGYLAGRWETLAGVGIQQKLLLVTARAGYATDLADASLLSAGLSVGPLHLGAARVDDGEFDGASREGWAFTMGLGVSAW